MKRFYLKQHTWYVFFNMNTYICVFFLLLGHKANHFHLVFRNFSLFLLFGFWKRSTNSKRGVGHTQRLPPPPPHSPSPILGPCKYIWNHKRRSWLSSLDHEEIKVASRVQKIEVFKKGWNFAGCPIVLRVASWKNIFFMEKRNGVFFLVFTMESSSDVLNYLNAHSILNFARTFLYF